MTPKHGLNPEDYARAVAAVGRDLSAPELGVLSAMWSEHCAYGSSRVHLRRLHTTGAAVVQGPGENAGAVHIGDGLAAVFKMESHNHPSYIEPFQGAATGVGGILRDVFTMGARPIAVMNSLRFGRWEHPRTRYLVRQVVAGIGGYANSFGVPTVGGEVFFHPSYDGNCLVNAFALGVVEVERLRSGTAAGVGNLVVLLGARTGRDGIHGATMASAAFGSDTNTDTDTDTDSDTNIDAESRRPTVQVGDPYLGKRLVEACLEWLEGEEVVGLQDLGAAGLTSASVEMARRAGTGLELELDRVPAREADMTPYELLLSESQERLLAVVSPSALPHLQAVFAKWDLQAAVVGRVTQDRVWRCTWHGEAVCALPVALLTDDAPLHDRPQRPPGDLAARRAFVEPACDAGADLLALLASPDHCSRRWIWRQYDHQVGTNTERGPGGDAALLRIKGTDTHLALSVDGNGRHVWLDPLEGAKGAVAECVRNLACVGATPLGATDCLNLGDPGVPEVMWQLARAVDGLAAACAALDVPIVSGNVSLYNQTGDTAVLPTPTVAVVGRVTGEPPAVRSRFARAGLTVAVLGAAASHGVGGSAWLSHLHRLDRGAPPPVDLDAERALHAVVRRLVGDGLVEVAHDVGDGGLALALAEACLGLGTTPAIGLVGQLPAGDASLAGRLFGEDHGRVVIGYAPEHARAVAECAAAGAVPLTPLGRTRGARLCLDGVLDLSVAAMQSTWDTAFPEWIGS